MFIYMFVPFFICDGIFYNLWCIFCAYRLCGCFCNLMALFVFNFGYLNYDLSGIGIISIYTFLIICIVFNIRSLISSLKSVRIFSTLMLSEILSLKSFSKRIKPSHL